MTSPRLHVLTATDSSAALVLRRGPSRAVATIGWDRESHAFTPGQWLKGRIYEYRADISPDGRHWVYFAGKGGSHWWTAVARVPWLRAVTFLPQTSTWGGGGAFDAEGRLWMNGAAPPADLPDGLRPAPRDAYPHSTDGFHMGGTYAALLERRGWRRSGPGQGYNAELTRDLPGGARLEITFAHGLRNRALTSGRYALVAPDGTRTERPDWEWADLWGDRLQFAARGALFEMQMPGWEARRLRDFSGMAFEAVEAPYEGVVA